jgi:hypothetical protein
MPGYYSGAHMGGAHMGQDEQVEKVQALVEKKQQLEAALPVVDDNRAIQIEARLDKIEAQLQREIARAQAIGNEAAVRAAMGLDGMGGLDFQAQAPAGVGRLLRLPFYPSEGTLPAAETNGCDAAVTSAGSATISSEAPIVTISTGASGDAANINISQSTQFQLKTPQISWATLRIVGFETVVATHNTSVSTAVTVVGSVAQPKLLVKDLKIGGGANLLTHEDFGDAAIYDALQPEFCGLRDYPILKSPNTATVDVAAVGFLNGNVAGLCGIQFACNLLCEVLQDDNYGSHIPGPYARGAAMVRRGGSFV